MGGMLGIFAALLLGTITSTLFAIQAAPETLGRQRTGGEAQVRAYQAATAAAVAGRTRRGRRRGSA